MDCEAPSFTNAKSINSMTETAGEYESSSCTEQDFMYAFRVVTRLRKKVTVKWLEKARNIRKANFLRLVGVKQRNQTLCENKTFNFQHI